jgi:hypothetical protein
MRQTLKPALLAFGLVLATASAASGPPNFVSDEVRASASEWGIATIVAQAEVKTEIDESKTAMMAGGGALFALIDAGVNSSRAKKAEAAIQPLRDALSGYDFDAEATATTTAAAREVGWLKVAEQRSGKDDSEPGLLALLDAGATPKLLYADYVYSLGPRGDRLVTQVTLTIASKEPPAGKRPEDRVKPKYLAYSQKLKVVTTLPSPSKELSDNIAQWSGDNAALARRTLAEELAALKPLIVRSLSAGAADVEVWSKDRKRTETVDGGTLSSDGKTLTLAHPLSE